LKVLINRKPKRDQAWGGGNLFVIALCDTLRAYGHEVVHTLDDDIDRILLMDPRYDELGISLNEVVQYRQAHPGTWVVHRVNECDARKGTEGIDDMLRFTSRFTDRTVFVSNWMSEYHLHKGWSCADTEVIINGVDKRHFKSANRSPGKTLSIVAHHWSDNPMKGQDVYEHLDHLVGSRNDMTFEYIGRTKAKFKNTHVVPPLHGELLGRRLANHDVYVTGTWNDPGPNHVLEAIACELPVLVHERGGGAVQFAGTDNVYTSLKELTMMLTKRSWKKTWGVFPVPWDECIALYMKALELE
jgi:glycosyltransferase involved in cell wall biosynthesis